MEQLKVQFQELIQKLRDKHAEYSVEGWSVKEIIKFILMCIFTLCKAVESIDVPGTEKKRFVLEVVEDIYWEFNPDWPFIPEMFERMLENLLLDNVLPAAVDLIIDAAKEEF